MTAYCCLLLSLFNHFHVLYPDEDLSQLSLTRKSSKVGNYRLERRLVPFDHRTTELEFQCKKCETCFETESEADEHEGTRTSIQAYVADF
jgi:hypothetical protein